jgi:hypothetical protein
MKPSSLFMLLVSLGSGLGAMFCVQAITNPNGSRARSVASSSIEVGTKTSYGKITAARTVYQPYAAAERLITEIDTERGHIVLAVMVRVVPYGVTATAVVDVKGRCWLSWEGCDQSYLIAE